MQLPSLLLERGVAACALGLVYSTMGCRHPWWRSACVNLLSLAVGMALDVRNRASYLLAASRRKGE